MSIIVCPLAMAAGKRTECGKLADIPFNRHDCHRCPMDTLSRIADSLDALVYVENRSVDDFGTVGIADAVSELAEAVAHNDNRFEE